MSKENRNYLVVEATVDGKEMTTRKIKELADSEGNIAFPEVYQMTDCNEFEVYEQKEDFLMAMLEPATQYFSKYGSNIEDIIIVAVEEETDIMQWGVKINLQEDGSFKYGLIDWKNGGHVFKYEPSEHDYFRDRLFEEEEIENDDAVAAKMLFQAIKSEKDSVSLESVFNLINCHDISTIHLQDNGKKICSLWVNQFISGEAVYDFSQAGAEGSIAIAKKDVVESEMKYEESINAVFIDCVLDDGKSLHVTIHNAGEIKESVRRGYTEADVYELMDFMDESHENGFRCGFVTITDSFGMLSELKLPFATVYEEEEGLKLHISTERGKIEIPVDEGSIDCYVCNRDESVTFIIQPFGNAFTTVKLHYFKWNE